MQTTYQQTNRKSRRRRENTEDERQQLQLGGATVPQGGENRDVGRRGVALGTVGSNLENAGKRMRQKGAGEGRCGLEEGFRGSAKSPLTCPGEERLDAPPPGLALAVPPEVPVLLVANGDLLTLVARQVD